MLQLDTVLLTDAPADALDEALEAEELDETDLFELDDPPLRVAAPLPVAHSRRPGLQFLPEAGLLVGERLAAAGHRAWLVGRFDIAGGSWGAGFSGTGLRWAETMTDGWQVLGWADGAPRPPEPIGARAFTEAAERVVREAWPGHDVVALHARLEAAGALDMQIGAQGDD